MLNNFTEREKKILEMLSENSSIAVADLRRVLDVSAVTIRNDLNSLAEKGAIIRTRGGALPAFHPSILDRQKHRTDAKNRIAKRAAELIKDGETVMIGAGTTTALIAKYLLGKRDIHIVTNSTLIVPYARLNPAIHLTVVGGEFRPSTESLVGPITLKELEQFHVKTSIVGTDGFSLKTGLTTHLVDGAEVVKRMAGQADRTVLIADSSKYGKEGFVKILPLTEFDLMITDDEMREEIVTDLEANGIQVMTT
ncbi:MAG: DeoR/GlpR family DNA-binding transcription regulator [Spirochaetia bacterium]